MRQNEGDTCSDITQIVLVMKFYFVIIKQDYNPHHTIDLIEIPLNKFKQYQEM